MVTGSATSSGRWSHGLAVPDAMSFSSLDPFAQLAKLPTRAALQSGAPRESAQELSMPQKPLYSFRFYRTRIPWVM
jgi:hypothetical protein